MRLLDLLLVSGAACATAIEPPTKVQKRDIIESASSIFNSVFARFPEATAAVEGVISHLSTLPSIDDTKRRLQLSERDIAALPLSALTFPTYANLSASSSSETGEIWHVFLNGMIYKVPNVTDEVLSEAADLYVSDVEVADLPTAKKRNAQNLTLALYSIPVENEGLQFHISANRTRLTSFPLPSLSSEHGVFSLFYPLEIDAEETIPRNLNRIVPLTVHTNITSPPSVDSSNSTIYLVPPTGTSIISDIDDILRLTKIWDPPLALNNTFIEDYKPWSNMPVVYKNWERRLEKPHFHYLSTVPMPGSRRYMEFIYDYYPVGSFESRPGNYTSLTEMRGVREKALRRYLGSFGQRRVVLVGDVSNRDVISGYAALAKEFDRVCVLIRNVTATDDSFEWPYDLGAFEGVDEEQWMLFNRPEDINGLDLDAGHCRNKSVPQPTDLGWYNVLDGAASMKGVSMIALVGGLVVGVLGSLL